MTIEDAFADFLTRKVNISDAMMIKLNDRVDAVTSFLRDQWEHAGYFDDFVPQGSLAQKTIIRPVNKPVFDADVLMLMRQPPGWSPATYTSELKRAFLASATYALMAHKRTRCVYIDYADEFHIDVVPYVVPMSSITNNKTDAYELSLPEAFNSWLDGKDRLANGKLPEIIRLLKFLRDKRQNATRSLFLTVLVGERIRWWDDGCYDTLPTAFATVVADLSQYLVDNPSLPFLPDPAGTGCNLADRWTEEGYTALRNWATNNLAPKVADAAAETETVKAELLWQDVFGSDFKLTSTALATKSAAALVPRSEQFLLRDLDIPNRLTGEVSLVGRVRALGVANKAYDLPTRGNRVGKGRVIDFEVRSCDVPAPYELYWKVRNRGDEAKQVGELRGEITKAPPVSMSRKERTAYRGSHFVEVYVVKNGVCVANDHQEVVVTR
ncbi:MAG: cyclic GMP-AMP synthase DncV-like nucleotidyltransferase [Actinomycetales bacterium]